MLRAELAKARTTRTATALTLGAAAAVALGTTSMVLSQPAEQISRGIHHQQFYFVTSIAVMAFAAVLGVRSFTDDFRYGSVVPTFLLEPRRGRVLAAKAMTAAAVAVGMAVIAQGVMVGLSVVLAGTKGVRPEVAATDVVAMLGLSAAAGLWAVMGVGVGAAIRHQIAAILGVVLWIVVIENLVVGFAGGVAAVLPGRAAHALADASAAQDLLLQPVGGIVLLAHAAVAVVVGLVFLRRDVPPAGS